MVVGCLPVGVFAAETDWEGDIDVVEPAGSSAENPIDLTTDLLYEDDFSATVTVPAGETYYYIAYRVGGMIMSINGGEGVECTTDGMMYPYDWSITNDGEAAAEYVITVSYPEGSMENPKAIDYYDAQTVSIEAGDMDGYYFVYTADCIGKMKISVESTAAGWSYTVNNLTAGTYGDIQNSNDESIVDTFAVTEGDKIEIVVNNFDPADVNNAPAGDITVSLEKLTGYCPSCATFLSPDMTVANAGTVYYQGRFGGQIVTFTGDCEFTVSLDGAEAVASSGGKVELTVPAAPGFPQPANSIVITGDGNITVTVAYPVGSDMNPAVAQLGDNVANIAAGGSEYVWNYTAEKDGDLVVTVTSTTGWQYTINNMTTYSYGDTQWSDSDPVVNPATIPVAEGDVIEIKVITYDPENMWSAPEGTITTNLAYKVEVSTGTIELSLPACNFVGAVEIIHYVKISGFEKLSQDYIMQNSGILIWEDEISEEDAVFGSTDRYTAGMKYDSYYGEYYGATDGIPAAEYYIPLHIRAYLKLEDGSYAYGPMMTYSVQQYCEEQIGKTKNENQKNLCIATLHFGAAAQIRFNKGVDTLANANIVDTYPLPEYNSSWIGTLGTYTSNLPVSDKITRTATPANVVGAVQLQYCVQTTVANVDKVELLYWYNTTEELTEANATVVPMEWDSYYKEYAAFTQGIPAAEYGYSVYMTAKVTDTDGNVYYGEIFTYGIDAYADYQYNRTGVSEAQKNLCHAMAYFGEMARIRFGK